MNKTAIEYLAHTWNPIGMRCTPVGPGCAHCWHLAMAKRQAKNPILSAERRAAAAGGLPVLLENELTAPLRLRDPARIGLQFMGDLFHGQVLFKDITDIFNVMCDERAQRHTFLMLTKRPERIREWLEWLGENEPGDSPLAVALEVCGHFGRNVWLGVTVENQDYTWRIDELLKIPAAVRLISYKPALGPLDLRNYMANQDAEQDTSAAAIWRGEQPGLDWLIAGGESGPGAQPPNPDWFRRVRNDCQAAGVPFFFEGWGKWQPLAREHGGPGNWSCDNPQGVKMVGSCSALVGNESGFGTIMLPVGKKTAGRLLDGRKWNEVPKTSDS